jgi:hypothetical protein
MTVNRLFLALFLPMALVACESAEPFVDNIGQSARVTKEKVTYGLVRVCFKEGDQMEALQELASEECGRGNFQAVYLAWQKWQCRLTVPHVAFFYCVEPGGKPPASALRSIQPNARFPAVGRDRDEGMDAAPQGVDLWTDK